MDDLMPPGLGDGNDDEEEEFSLVAEAPPGAESDEHMGEEHIVDDPGTPLEHENDGSPFHDLEQQALEQAQTNGEAGLEEEVDQDQDQDEEDDSDSDSDVVVKIGDIKANVPFHSAPKPSQAVGVSAGKLDIDQSATIDGQPIYDLDLAQMEDKPWRKPGADITDYFNYGFTEETWNMYCERQKKLRAEFGNQAAANKALFSSINLANPSAPIMQVTSRPQNVTVLGSYPTNNSLSQAAQGQNQQPTKIVVNLSEKFRNPPPTIGDQGNKIGSPMFRTVLTPGQPPRQTSIPTLPTPQSMSVPPPNMQPVVSQQQQQQSQPPQQQPQQQLQQQQQVSTITRLGGAAAPTIIMSSANSNTAPVVSFSSSSGPISLDQPPPSGQDYGDFSQPPPSTPDYSHPPPAIKQDDFGGNKDYSQPPPIGGGGGGADGPPGVDELAPPGSTPPPGNVSSSQPPPTMQMNDPNAQVRQITTLGAPPINMSVPPPRFNPNLPPPGMGPPGVGTIPTVRLGLPPTNMPPPPFGHHLLPPGVGVPPPGYRFPPTSIRPPMMGRAGFGGIPQQHQPPHMQEGERSPASYSDKSSDLDDGDYRHKPSSSQGRGGGGRYTGSGGGPPMRRRSRSRSPGFSPSTRGPPGGRSRRSDDRDRESTHKRSRHRSRSRSPSPHESSRSSSRRKDDDKKKRKDDDDKDRKKRRRKSDDEGDKKEESSKKKRSRKDD